jgi:serine/threonine-protein kinase
MNLLDAIELHLPRGYSIHRKLGDGATSSVYLASRPDGIDRLAVKVMLMGTVTDESLDRFVREMQILEKLDHPGIPRILEAGEANGSLFFTMPYIEGQTLRTFLGGVGRLSVRDALLIARDIGDALDYAHSRGVVHRDVKPANIYMAADRAYLMDFGLASSSDSGVQPIRDRGNLLGTPEYMSPEQATGAGIEDWRSDFFSLGCVLFEMLAGHLAFGGETVRETIARRINASAPDIRTIRADVPEDVAAILKRTLDPYPAGRYATGAMLRGALEAALSNANASAGDTVPYTVRAAGHY